MQEKLVVEKEVQVGGDVRRRDGGGGGGGGCHLPCVGLTWQGMRERYEGRGGGAQSNALLFSITPKPDLSIFLSIYLYI